MRLPVIMSYFRNMMKAMKEMILGFTTVDLLVVMSSQPKQQEIGLLLHKLF